MHKESVEVYQWASSNMQDWTEMSEMSLILQTTCVTSVQLSCSVKLFAVLQEQEECTSVCCEKRVY